MFERPSQQELANLAMEFPEVDVSESELQSFKGRLPSGTIYMRQAKCPEHKGLTDNQFKLSDNILVSWGPSDPKLEFQCEDHNWIFKFSKPPSDFLALSWSLNASEIERLNKHLQVSISVADMTDVKNSPVEASLYSRLNYVKGTDKLEINRGVDQYEGRYYAGFSLDDPRIQPRNAHRLWLDFIISDLKTKEIVLHDPAIIIQNNMILV